MADFLCRETEDDLTVPWLIVANSAKSAAEKFAERSFHSDPADWQEINVSTKNALDGHIEHFHVKLEPIPSFVASRVEKAK